MSKLVIDFHSGYGHTRKVADASSKPWFTQQWKDKLAAAFTNLATRNDIDYVASSSGLMTATPSDASVDERVPGDTATAQAFGKRVAKVTAKLFGCAGRR